MTSQVVCLFLSIWGGGGGKIHLKWPAQESRIYKLSLHSIVVLKNCILHMKSHFLKKLSTLNCRTSIPYLILIKSSTFKLNLKSNNFVTWSQVLFISISVSASWSKTNRRSSCPSPKSRNLISKAGKPFSDVFRIRSFLFASIYRLVYLLPVANLINVLQF